MPDNKLPYFRWYPKDAETDEAFRTMTFAQRGFYITCLNHAWINDGLPQNERSLATLLHISVSKLRTYWKIVGPKFELGPNGRYVNVRQESERTKALIKSDKARASVLVRYERSTSEKTNVSARALARAGSESEYRSSLEESEKPFEPEIPKPKPKPKLPPVSGEESPAHWAERMYTRHPKAKNRTLVEQWVAGRWAREPDPVNFFRQVDAVHEAWCESEEWQGTKARFAPSLDRWLDDRGYSKLPHSIEDEMPTEANTKRKRHEMGEPMFPIPAEFLEPVDGETKKQ